jgi:hypothetical protein
MNAWRSLAVGCLAIALAGCAGAAGQTSGPLATSQGTGQPGSSAQADTPAPADSAPAAFTPIELSGHGNKVAKFKIPEDAPGIAVITNKGGSSNFTVEALDSSGGTNALLVNVIGAYSGTRLFDAGSGEHSVAFKIESDGNWTVRIQPVTSAPSWDGASQRKGKGDAVIQVSPAVSGLTTAVIKHSGEENFVVTTYGPDGSDLIVNDIGAFSGEQQLADGTFLIEIEADGGWSITPS